MIEIKPCPFCGGESLVYSHGSAIVRFFAKCSVCQVHTDTEMGSEQAADVWNSRVEQPSEADKWLAEATAQRDRADKADEMVAFLKKELARVANFNCDWDMLKACQESWRELAGEHNKLKKEHDQLTESLDHARRMLAYSGKLQ